MTERDTPPLFLSLIAHQVPYLVSMTGKSHVAANAFLSFALFQNPFICLGAIFAAKMPDQMETFLPMVKHRGATHIMSVWAGVGLIAGIGVFLPGIPMFSFAGLGIELHSVIFGFVLGGFLHIFMDYLSVSGVPILPGRTHAAAKWYKTGTLSEYLVLSLVIFGCAIVLCATSGVVRAGIWEIFSKASLF